MKNQEPKIGEEIAKFWEELLEERYNRDDYPECQHPSLEDMI